MSAPIINKLKQQEWLKSLYRIFRKLILNILKTLMNLIGYVFITPFAILVPKKNRVMLASRFGDFEGNLKYLFLALNEEKGQEGRLDIDPETEFIFLTGKDKIYRTLQEKGYRVWKYQHPSTWFKLLQVKVLIVDGNEWAAGFKYFLLYGAKTVQIWHGTGLKAIGLLKPNYQDLGKIHKFFRKENTNYNMLSLSSEDQVKNRGKAFNYEKLLINGLPRNDVFFDEKVLKRSLDFDGDSIEPYRRFKNEGYRLVTYTPTWRKRQGEFFQLDPEKLEAFGEKYKIKWIIKLHYKHDIPVDVTGLKHVMEYDKTADIYPLLAITDLLITDYSSIYLDYLLLNKPIVFFPYDEAEYVNGERALLLDYDDVTPGPKVHTQAELQDAVKELLSAEKDAFEQEREALRKSFFKYRDGASTKRLWESIKDSYLKN